VRKAARKEAAGVVLEVAGRLERIRSQLLSYPTDAADLTPLAQNTKRYGITVTSVNSGKGFTITAAPSGDQQKDPCGTITYDQTGFWKFTYNSTEVPESDCL
jgi:type IV pilus assembly protein PilE